MTAFKQTEKDIEAIKNDPLCVPVAKLPEKETVTKCVPGEKYLCTDTGEWSVAKEGEALITRHYPDGSMDTYKNKKGPKYAFDNGKSWDDLQPGESAVGILKDGPEFDRFAILANPNDTVDAVWDETQKVTRDASYITVIYDDKKFNMEGDNKWGSKQIVLNNNAGDTHLVDPKMKDENGNPMVIGKLPLTAEPKEIKKEIDEHVKKFYGGKLPEHLQPQAKFADALIQRKEIRRSMLKVAAKVGEKGTVLPKQSQEHKVELGDKIKGAIIQANKRSNG